MKIRIQYCSKSIPFMSALNSCLSACRYNLTADCRQKPNRICYFVTKYIRNRFCSVFAVYLLLHSVSKFCYIFTVILSVKICSKQNFKICFRQIWLSKMVQHNFINMKELSKRYYICKVNKCRFSYRECSMLDRLSTYNFTTST